MILNIYICIYIYMCVFIYIYIYIYIYINMIQTCKPLSCFFTTVRGIVIETLENVRLTFYTAIGMYRATLLQF